MYVLNSITHGSDNSGAQRRIRSLTCLTLIYSNPINYSQHELKIVGGILARIRNKAHVRPTRPAFQSLGGKQAGD
ncbi:Deoxyguanosinetriphosphate triphosphohydrolase-like protein [Trichinella pseudospiralis]